MNLEEGDEDDHPPYHKYITEQTIHTNIITITQLSNQR